ncbi:hypothetical protein ES702_05197 [subsurface metagenome]
MEYDNQCTNNITLQFLVLVDPSVTFPRNSKHQGNDTFDEFMATSTTQRGPPINTTKHILLHRFSSNDLQAQCSIANTIDCAALSQQWTSPKALLNPWLRKSTSKLYSVSTNSLATAKQDHITFLRYKLSSLPTYWESSPFVGSETDLTSMVTRLVPMST